MQSDALHIYVHIYIIQYKIDKAIMQAFLHFTVNFQHDCGNVNMIFTNI